MAARTPATRPLPREVSLMRMAALGLIPATAAPDPAGAVSRLLAIQGQQVSAIFPAILARTTANVSAVREAFDTAQLVRSWPMRGTVHVTAAADHHWLRAALLHRYESWMRSSETNHQLRADNAIERAAEVALAAIAAEGPLSRADALELWEEAGLFPDGQPTPTGPGITESYEAMARRRHLILLLHMEGILVQAPVGTNEHLLIDASTLPPETAGPGGGASVRHGQAGHEAALVEIARRYALGHGPVNAADLARWTTLSVSTSYAALESALEAEPALTRVSLDQAGTALVADRGQGTAAQRRARSYYMRADLPDLVASHRRELESTRALPSFDELHVGYKDRSCLTDEAGERLICPSKNGIFRPIVVRRGQVVAVNPASGGLQYHPHLRQSKTLATQVQRALKVAQGRLQGR